MPELVINPLPHYVNQLEAGRSQMRCAEASGSMCLDFAYPGQYNSNLLKEIMHEAYVKYCSHDGLGDVPANQQGTTKEQVFDFFKGHHVGYVDMPVHDPEWLFHEMREQNRQGYIQLLTVADESQMIEYGTNAVMHPWPCKDAAHTFVRLGCNTDEPYGLYYDPVASRFCYDTATGKSKAVKIGKDHLLAGRVITALCIMKHTVSPPPSGFSFQQGVWPVPPPAINLDRAAQAIHGMDAPLQALKNMADALDSNHLHTVVGALEASQKSILVDIGKG